MRWHDRVRIHIKRFGNPAGGRTKLQCLEKPQQYGRIRLHYAKITQRHRRRHILLQGDNLPADPSLIGKLDEIFSPLVLFDFSRALKNTVEVPVFID